MFSSGDFLSTMMGLGLGLVFEVMLELRIGGCGGFDPILDDDTTDSLDRCRTRRRIRAAAGVMIPIVPSVICAK